jgi:hypothetical protein
VTFVNANVHVHTHRNRQQATGMAAWRHGGRDEHSEGKNMHEQQPTIQNTPRKLQM